MFKRKSISMNFFIQMYFFCLHIYFFSTFAANYIKQEQYGRKRQDEP